MRPWLEPVARLSADLPPDLALYAVRGDLARSNLDEFFRRLAFETAGFRTIILDMTEVGELGQSAVDRFAELACEMEIRGRRLALASLPASLYRHQIRTAAGRCARGIRFHETVEEALAALALEA